MLCYNRYHYNMFSWSKRKGLTVLKKLPPSPHPQFFLFFKLIIFLSMRIWSMECDIVRQICEIVGSYLQV